MAPHHHTLNQLTITTPKKHISLHLINIIRHVVDRSAD